MAKQPKIHSKDYWRDKLTAQQFHVCWEQGTERPFTGNYHDHKEKGVYRCACCGNELFASGAKYDSGTGWPSFYQALADDGIETETDTSLGITRTEISCARCGAHLGHVFPDGPRPTGLRYCVNSAALSFEASEDGL